jgi:hypothetical protein
MPMKTIERPVAANRRAPADRAKDGPWLPGLADALEVYRRIARVGGVGPHALLPSHAAEQNRIERAKG